jgi:oxygen-independent coproporphyrinogen-3 oxidase
MLLSIEKYSKISSDTEISMELDPASFNKNKLNEYLSIGVNRVSMGVQSLVEKEFNNLGRGHKFLEIM